MKVIAYTYEADTHCEGCAKARFGTDGHGWVPDGAIDGEGNPVHALFNTDEWWANDAHEGHDKATLVCGTCHAQIESVTL